MKTRVAMFTAALFLAAASYGSQASRAEDAGIIKGCWFTPPNPPACDICRDNCNPGQNCCVIIHL